MQIRRIAHFTKSEELGDRQLRVICSTGDVDRMGDIVVQDGIDLSAYRNNPIVLWSHDPEKPIGRATSIGVSGGKLVADVEFAPQGISPKADEICGLAKAGIINAVSIGFQPVEYEPVDPKRPYGAQRFLKSELMEFSFVSIPANTGAAVVERDAKASEWKVGATRDLPIDISAAWDGSAATERMLDAAGFNGDSPDTARARKGFLVYDSANPTLKGSYKLPFADIVDGELKAVKGGLDAAATRIGGTDIPDAVRDEAKGVLDACQQKAGEASKFAAVVDRRALGTFIARMRRKDLYDVGYLAWILSDLGYVVDCTAWEAALEGDGSQVPQMIADAMQAVAQALLAMTAEEVAEALANAQADVAGALPSDDVEIIVMSAPRVARAKAMASWLGRAGRVLSSSNETDLRTARDKIDGVLSQVQSDDAAEEKSAEAQQRIREAEALALAIV